MIVDETKSCPAGRRHDDPHPARRPSRGRGLGRAPDRRRRATCRTSAATRAGSARSCARGRVLACPGCPRGRRARRTSATTASSTFAGDLIAPLIHHDRVIGALAAVTCEPRDWTSGDVAFITTLATHAAIALTNAELFEQTEARAAQLERPAGGLGPAEPRRDRRGGRPDRRRGDPPDHRLPQRPGLPRSSRPTTSCRSPSRARVGAYEQVDIALLRTQARRGLHRLGRPARRAAPRQRREPRPARREHPGHRRRRRVDARRADALRRGDRSGSSRSPSSASTSSTTDDLRLLTILADQAATAVESARLLTRTQDLAGELRRLLDMSAELSEQPRPAPGRRPDGRPPRPGDGRRRVRDQLLGPADRPRRLARLLPADPGRGDGAVLRRRRSSRRRCASSSARRRSSSTPTTRPPTRPRCALLRQDGQPGPGDAAARREGPVDRARRALLDGRRSRCDAERLALARTMANEAAMALENARLYEDARNLADRDPLTGFYNHRFLHERLGEEVVRAQRGRRPLSVLMLDLDDFKLVNDTFGHLFGDRVLTWTAELIRSTLRGVRRPGPLRRRRVRDHPARDRRATTRASRRRADPRRVPRSAVRRRAARAGADRGVDRRRDVPGRRPDRDRADRRGRPGPLPRSSGAAVTTPRRARGGAGRPGPAAPDSTKVLVRGPPASTTPRDWTRRSRTAILYIRRERTHPAARRTTELPSIRGSAAPGGSSPGPSSSSDSLARRAPRRPTAPARSTGSSSALVAGRRDRRDPPSRGRRRPRDRSARRGRVVRPDPVRPVALRLRRTRSSARSSRSSPTATGADHIVVVRRRPDARVLEATLVSARPGVPDSTTLLPLGDLEDPVVDDARAAVARSRSSPTVGVAAVAGRAVGVRRPARRGRAVSTRGPARAATGARRAGGRLSGDGRGPSPPCRRGAGIAASLAGGAQPVADRIADRVRGAYGLTHTLAAPLRRSDDGVIGAIVLSRRTGGAVVGHDPPAADRRRRSRRRRRCRAPYSHRAAEARGLDRRADRAAEPALLRRVLRAAGPAPPGRATRSAS